MGIQAGFADGRGGDSHGLEAQHQLDRKVHVQIIHSIVYKHRIFIL